MNFSNVSITKDQTRLLGKMVNGEPVDESVGKAEDFARLIQSGLIARLPGISEDGKSCFQINSDGINYAYFSGQLESERHKNFVILVCSVIAAITGIISVLKGFKL